MDKSFYFRIDKRIKKLASAQQLQSKESEWFFLALIFEDQSYVIVDQSGHPTEYSPAEYTYREGVSHSQWRLLSEAPIEFSQ